MAASTLTAGSAPVASTTERLRLSLLWMTGLAGAFVFTEPSAYEVVSLTTILLFVFTGLAFNLAIMPLALLLVTYNVGFSFAVISIAEQPRVVTWVLISWYLGATAIFFACVLGTNTLSRLSLIVRGYTAAAVVASLAAVTAYFNLIPGESEFFLRYGRAQGTFNDPNVLGAFLIFPALVALQRVFLGGVRGTLVGSFQLLLFSAAVLLSFSRAAWGQLAFCLVLLMFLTFLTSQSSRVRIRVVLLAFIGCLALIGFIAALLSVDQVAALFRERASLDQSYDAGPMGRFGRHITATLLALQEPLGIGPMQFAKRFVEDPHNAYLNAFMAGGWLSGLSYAAMVILTWVLAARFIFVRSPWQQTYLAVFVAFTGLTLESCIIDSDHWRHYFLILGLQWGLIAATWRMSAGARVFAHHPLAPVAYTPYASPHVGA